MLNIKKFTLHLLVGVNIGIIALMLATGLAGHVDAAVHPRLSVLGLTFPLPLAANVAMLVAWLFIRPRYALVPLAGLVAGYAPVHTYLPINPPHEAPQGAIRVVSYNVAGFGTAIGQSPAVADNPIARYLADTDADIICLQEAAGHEWAADSLLRADHPHTSFQRRHGSGDVLAVYSRFPIRRSEPIDYPSRGNSSFAYVIDVRGREVLLVNNHLETNGLEPEDKRQFSRMVRGRMEGDTARAESKHLMAKLADAARRRAAQVDAVCRYISSHRGGKTVIAVGDFNESPISYSHTQMARRLTDCYVASGTGPGWSYCRNGMRVRIDNIFCSDDATPYGARVDHSITESDHYPISCWIKLRGVD